MPRGEAPGARLWGARLDNPLPPAYLDSMRQPRTSHRAWPPAIGTPCRAGWRAGWLVGCLVGLVLLGHARADDAPRFSLDDLLRRAEASNPAMDIARATLRDYQALFDRAYYAWTPSLRVESLLAPLPERRELRRCVVGSYFDADSGASLPEVGACPGQNVEADERITADTELGILTRTTAKITFPIYTFGRVEHGLEAARAGVDAARAGLDIARGELGLLVKQAYYGAQLADRALAILRDGRKRLSKTKADIEAELEKESGRFTSNDLRKLLVEEADIVSSVLETEALSDVAWAGLRIAAGVAPGGPIALDTMELSPVHVESRTVEAYVELALESRPELRAARAALRAQRGQVEMAESEFLPNIALVGAFGYALGTTADDPDDPFYSDNYNFLNWGVVIGATWRIDFAALSSALSRAQARASKQAAQAEALAQRVRLEVVEQVGDMNRRAQELEVRHTAMKAAKGWLVSNSLNFGLGLVTTDQLIKSLIAYSRAQLNYDRTIYELNLAVARLSRTVGTELAVPSPDRE